MELASNLLRRCKEKGITLSELVRRSGVKQPTLFGSSDPYESGEEILQEVNWGKVRIVMYMNSTKENL